MDTKIFLQKFRSKNSSNTSSGLNIGLNGRRKLLPLDDVSQVISQYKQYSEEREKCNIIRLTCQVNPICTNVLFNKISEVVKGEGTDKITFLNYGVSNDGNKAFENVLYKDKTLSAWTKSEAIRDTQLSRNGKDGNHFVYHCGVDIFNNHLLRSKTFKTVCKMREDSIDVRNFNTIADKMRDVNGEAISETLYYPVSSGVDSREISEMHLYQSDDIDTFEDCVSQKLISNYNGWLGFYNKSKIKSYKDFTNSESLEVERPLMYENSGNFVDMYPTRDLFSFVPKYNSARERIEKNWNYCITYPSSSYTPSKDGDPFSDVIECNDGLNSLKAIYFDENTRSDNGSTQLVIYGIAKHGLKKGDYVNVYKTYNGTLYYVALKDKRVSDYFDTQNEVNDAIVRLKHDNPSEYKNASTASTNTTINRQILDSAEVMEVVDDYIFTVPNSDVQISKYWSNTLNPHDYSKDYLTFTVNGGSLNFKFTKSGLSYSKDSGTTWSRLESDGVTVENGKKIMWKGMLTPTPSSGIGIFSVSASSIANTTFDVEGNVMSLIYGDEFKGKTSLNGYDYAFANLFAGSFLMGNANNLSLPAIKLSKGCYQGMFSLCTKLLNPPMLLAPTLVESCYQDMFSSCTALKSIVCLATDISASGCTTNWVYGASSSGTFTKAESMTSWKRGVSGIPNGWGKPKNIPEGTDVNNQFTVERDESDGGAIVAILDDSKKFYRDISNIDKKYYIVNDSYVNFDDTTLNLSYKKVVNGMECDYYVRIFSKLPNFKFASGDTSNEYEIYKKDASGNSMLSIYQGKEYEFENHLSKLAFAKNIYSDGIGEVVFTDDIDLSNIKDNLGRPLSSLYLTFIKNNMGYKEWYGSSYISDWNEEEIFAPSIEYSHCFGKVTCGIETSIESRYESSINSINKINNGDGNISGYEIGGVINPNSTYMNGNKEIGIESNEVWYNAHKHFYGDLCCYDNYNAIEESIQQVMHRFNTAQRESSSMLSSGYFRDYAYDEITNDDYNNINDGDFKIETITSDTVNELHEGYYYKPHYEIPIKSFGKLQTAMPMFLSMRRISQVEASTNIYQIVVLQQHFLGIGDKAMIYDMVDDKYYDCVTISGNGDNYRVFTCNVYDEDGNEKNDLDLEISRYRLFKLDNLEIPSYAKLLKDGSCRYIWRPILNNGFNKDDASVEEYPFTNGAFYVNKKIDIYVRRQDPYSEWGLYENEDIIGEEINFSAENNYVKENEIVC